MSTPSDKTNYHPLFELDLHSPSGPIRNMYQVKNLSKFITNSANQPIHPKLTPRQRKILSRPAKDCERTSIALQEVLMDMLPLLDHCFFSGSLLKRLNGVRFYGNPSTEEKDSQQEEKYKDDRSYFNKTTGVIWINIFMQQRPLGTMTEQYTFALLHEMIHAFFHFYTCPGCCDDCTRETWAWEGCGHWDAWMDAAVSVERCWDEQVGWDVDLGVWQALEAEVRDSRGKWRPTDGDLQRWGLERGKVEGQFKRCFEEAKTKEREEMKEESKRNEADKAEGEKKERKWNKWW